MASFGFHQMPQFSMNHHQQQPFSAAHANSSAASNNNHHHGGRSRRGHRYASGHNGNKQFKQQQPRVPRENPEALQTSTFRKDYEAARSFDLEDDEIFCPWHLLTEDDLHSITSASSDRSSSSSGSPQQSPMQQLAQPTPAFSLSAAASSHIPTNYSTASRIHAPQAQRTRNAIPIVDPATRNVSPPTSVSPAHIQKAFAQGNRRW